MDQRDAESLEVLWPGGRSRAGRVDISGGVADLAGKTLAFVSDYAFRAEEIFAFIEAELTTRHPGMRFVPASTFGDVHGHDEPAVIAAMPDKLRAEAVDAVVVGVGA